VLGYFHMKLMFCVRVRPTIASPSSSIVDPIFRLCSFGMGKSLVFPYWFHPSITSSPMQPSQCSMWGLGPLLPLPLHPSWILFLGFVLSREGSPWFPVLVPSKHRLLSWVQVFAYHSGTIIKCTFIVGYERRSRAIGWLYNILFPTSDHCAWLRYPSMLMAISLLDGG